MIVAVTATDKGRLRACAAADEPIRSTGQLQRDDDLSLADYRVLCASSMAPNRKVQVTDLAAVICWERGRFAAPSEATG
jgi:hypothetical protein